MVGRGLERRCRGGQALERERSVGCRRRILYSLAWYLLERDGVALASDKEWEIDHLRFCSMPSQADGTLNQLFPYYAIRTSTMAQILSFCQGTQLPRTPVFPSSRMRDTFHQGTFLLQCCLQSSNAWIEEQLEKRKFMAHSRHVSCGSGTKSSMELIRKWCRRSHR